MTAAASVAATLTPGIAEYLQGRDRRALAMLTDEVASGDAPREAYLALSDLLARRSELGKARRTLETLPRASESEVDARDLIWIAWVDFLDGDATSGIAGLQAVVDAFPDSRTAAEASFSLGWQQLLRGDTRAAAHTFGRLAERRAVLRGVADHALLLEGQALLWNGRIHAAAARFRTLLARAPRSRVADDAARDLAWCTYLDGDTEGARTALARVTADYRDTRYVGQSSVRLRWTRALRAGPTALERPLLQALRRRPRGQYPFEFLLRASDRSGSHDARALAASLSPGEHALSTHRTSHRIHSTDDQSSRAAAQSRRASNVSAARQRTGMSPYLLLGLIPLVAALRRAVRRHPTTEGTAR